MIGVDNIFTSMVYCIAIVVAGLLFSRGSYGFSVTLTLFLLLRIAVALENK